jgi:hypothetical protein
VSESEKRELVRLLEYRTLSDFERRRRRLLAIPLSVVPEALERSRKGLPLSTEQYIAANLGFLPPHPGKMPGDLGEGGGLGQRWRARKTDVKQKEGALRQATQGSQLTTNFGTRFNG